MIKKLVIVAVILGFAWSIPAARQRMMQWAEPALERLGPVGERVVTPVRRYNTRNEIVFLMRALAQDYEVRRPLPNPRTFPAWLERNTPAGREGKDGWGNPYYMRADRLGITIGSPGPDGTADTADDITRTMPF